MLRDGCPKVHPEESPIFVYLARADLHDNTLEEELRQLHFVVPRGQELDGLPSQGVRDLLERRVRFAMEFPTLRFAFGALPLRFPVAVVRCTDVVDEVLANVVTVLRSRTRVVSNIVPREYETIENGDVVPLDERILQIRVGILLYAGECRSLAAILEEPMPELVSGLVDRQRIESQYPHVLPELLGAEERSAR